MLIHLKVVENISPESQLLLCIFFSVIAYFYDILTFNGKEISPLKFFRAILGGSLIGTLAFFWSYDRGYSVAESYILAIVLGLAGRTCLYSIKYGGVECLRKLTKNTTPPKEKQ